MSKYRASFTVGQRFAYGPFWFEIRSGMFDELDGEWGYVVVASDGRVTSISHQAIVYGLEAGEITEVDNESSEK